VARRRPKSPRTKAKPSPAAGARVTKGELSRLHLLKAAARVFRAKGFAETTIRDIAREAGIALGGLYFHFRSKQEFIGAVLTHGMAAIDQDVRAAVAALPAGATPRQQIETAGRAQYDATVRHGEFMSMRHLTSEMTREGWLEFATVRESYRRFWLDLMAAAQQAGALRADVDATTLVFYFLGPLTWMHEWYDPARKSADRILDDFSSLFFEGAQGAAPRPPANQRR
jgi:AcrR family transcriptional regulator